MTSARKKYLKRYRALHTAIYAWAKASGNYDRAHMKKLSLHISGRDIKPDFTKIESYKAAWDSLKSVRDQFGVIQKGETKYDKNRSERKGEDSFD